jgi:hypothetical protein
VLLEGFQQFRLGQCDASVPFSAAS